MNYQGLRDWLAKIATRGELTTLEDVDWNLEMGAIVDVLYREHPPYPPALVFDKIKDHAPGFRALFGHFASPQRIALTLGVDEEFDHVLEFTRMYHEKIKHCVPLAMAQVKSGPVHEHCQEGSQIDLSIFPAPLLHEKDGGRYIGTGHLVITKDPDSDWINVGTYRIMLQDRSSAGIYIGPGKHGYIHKQKYFERNQPKFGAVCPRQKSSLSQQSHRLLRQSGQTAAHAHVAARDHALGACVGRAGEGRRTGGSRRLVQIRPRILRAEMIPPEIQLAKHSSRWTFALDLQDFSSRSKAKFQSNCEISSTSEWRATCVESVMRGNDYESR
jgi:hypothetical protein